MKDEVITPEERALGAFLSAMYDQRLDGTKMREAMLKVLGIAAPKALEPLTEHVSYATTVMALIEDYAKAVHDGDDNSCTVLRRTIKASLEQPPKAMEPTILKPFTPCVCHDETAKRYCKDKGKCTHFEAHGITKGTP